MAPRHKVQNSLKHAKPSQKNYQTKKTATTVCKEEEGSKGKQTAGKNIDDNSVKSKRITRIKTETLYSGNSDHTQNTTKPEMTYLQLNQLLQKKSMLSIQGTIRWKML